MKLQLPLASGSQSEPLDPEQGSPADVQEFAEVLKILNEQQKIADERVATWLDKTEHWININERN